MKIKFNLLRNFLLFASLIFSSQNLKANAAQPGIWGAGGTTFTMLYPEDSASFKKVQMQREQIFVQLYKGFAVVKGVYFFKNHSKEKLSFKMGYPVNGIFSGGSSNLNQIDVDSLSAFKIFSNGNPLSIVKQPAAEDIGKFQSFSENWHVWQMDFLPEEIKKVEVFFIVSTNGGGIRKGYSLEHYNAFLYLLESGSVWKNPIEKGDFYIQLKDGLTEKDVHGISDNFNFQYNPATKVYWGSKQNLTPTPKDNLIFTYFEKIENFNLQNILAKSQNLEKEINQFSKTDFQKLSFEKAQTKNPYEVSSFFSDVISWFFALIFIIPGILLVALLVFVGYKIFKKKKLE